MEKVRKKDGGVGVDDKERHFVKTKSRDHLGKKKRKCLCPSGFDKTFFCWN